MATKKNDPRRFASKVVETVVLRAEEVHEATAITHHEPWGDPKAIHRLGGSCSCCGASPTLHIGTMDDDGDHGTDWLVVFKAGLVDSDGVYYSMLCGLDDGSGCLGSIRAENARRTPTCRDEAATLVTDLLEDDPDGAQAMMEDFDALGFFADEE